MDTTTQTLEKEPLVSILMLTYNRAHFIQRAIESVLAQTYQNWELVIIDDGSTDTTTEVVAAHNNSRITYIRHSKNAGLYQRRRESLGEVRGKYIAILDSDDYWNDSKKLQAQAAFLETNVGHVLVGTFTTIVDENDNVLGRSTFATSDDAIRARILARNQFTHSSVLMRTSAVEKTYGYLPTLAEDLELFLQLGLRGKLANLPSYSTNHRIHLKSENDRGIEMARSIHKIIQTYRTKYPYFPFAWCMSMLRILKAHVFKQKVY